LVDGLVLGPKLRNQVALALAGFVASQVGVRIKLGPFAVSNLLFEIVVTRIAQGDSPQVTTVPATVSTALGTLDGFGDPVRDHLGMVIGIEKLLAHDFFSRLSS
jgi:hypothetical protein